MVLFVEKDRECEPRIEILDQRRKSEKLKNKKKRDRRKKKEERREKERRREEKRREVFLKVPTEQNVHKNEHEYSIRIVSEFDKRNVVIK